MPIALDTCRTLSIGKLLNNSHIGFSPSNVQLRCFGVPFFIAELMVVLIYLNYEHIVLNTKILLFLLSTNNFIVFLFVYSKDTRKKVESRVFVGTQKSTRKVVETFVFMGTQKSTRNIVWYRVAA